MFPKKKNRCRVDNTEQYKYYLTRTKDAIQLYSQNYSLSPLQGGYGLPFISLIIKKKL